MQQLQGVYNLQEPHFWTLCTDVYIGTLKLLVAPDADTRWILSQTHHVFTQVPERTTSRFLCGSEHDPGLDSGPCCLCRQESDSCTFRLRRRPCRSSSSCEHLGPIALSLLFSDL